ncbi:MAG: InlB B-repeat-containing protein [Bacilli bacterium]
MKNFIEKVKANKLRSALIGISVFLFGFIAVNVFNNVGVTYAIGYTCVDSGWHYIGMVNGAPGCCPSGYTYDERVQLCHADPINSMEQTCPAGGTYSDIYLGDGIKNCRTVAHKVVSCYYCSATKEYIWSSSGILEKSCPSTWIGKSGVSQTNCKRGDACYRCRNLSGEGYTYVWGLYGDSGSCAYQNDITSSSNCNAKNIKTLSVTFNTTDGGTITGNTTAECTTTQSSPNSCKVTTPTATRSGYYLQGWGTSSSCSSYRSVNSDGTITISSSTPSNLYACWGTEPPNNGNYNPTIDEDATVAYTRPIYTVTYDLDGGKFIDGTTSRTSYIPSDKAIGDPKTNPIKDGMKFKEWQLNGNKFDFSQKPTQNITLKAVYEELTEEDKLYYCESSSDVLEVSTKTCYNVMKLDESKKLYNYTLYSYAAGGTFCYAYDATNNTPGGVYFRTDVSGYETITGKNNADYSSFGYPEKEAWVSKDTCLIATECTEDASIDRPACETRWDAIIYSTKSALLKEEKFDEDGTDVPIDDEPIDPDTPSDDEKNDNDKDVSDSPKTGDALILIAWVVGIGAIGYTVYYFRKRKED